MTAIINWLAELDPVFAFLLALPFVVVAAGFVSEASVFARRRRNKRRRQNEKPPSHSVARYANRAWSR